MVRHEAKRQLSVSGWANRTKVLFTALACVCTMISSSYVHCQDLQLTLTPVDTVQAFDSVTVALEFKNIGDSAIVLYNWRSGGGTVKPIIGSFLKFDIIRNGTDTLEPDYFGTMPKLPYEGDTIIVQPGEIYAETLLLNQCYLNASAIESNLESHKNIRNWLAGDYQLQCRYRYQHDPHWSGGGRLWRGSAESNTVHVRIVTGGNR